MTEREWLTDDAHAQHMVGHLQVRGLPRTKAGRRRRRLFACGCCRTAWDLLPAERSRDAVRVAEHFADGLANKEKLAGARAAGLTVTSGSLSHAPAVAADMAAACYPRAFAAAFAMTCTGGSLPGRGVRARLPVRPRPVRVR